MRFLTLTLLVAVLYSCGATVHYDYDKTTDFSSYQSYNYYSDRDSGLNDLDDRRIMRTTDSLLRSKGFIKSDQPQFSINFYTKEYLTNSGNSIGIGVGGGGGNVGVGVSGGIPIGGHMINQILTLDFVDVSQDKLIWKAIGDSKIKEKANPSQKEVYYTNLLSKMLSGYPPKIKKN